INKKYLAIHILGKISISNITDFIKSNKIIFNEFTKKIKKIKEQEISAKSLDIFDLKNFQRKQSPQITRDINKKYKDKKISKSSTRNRLKTTKDIINNIFTIKKKIHK
ncbi:MAG: hypothetical protein IKN42_07095, partial [Elusimicrobia bacterium]|nr:hypothetical protein [Elusimicrobiota bacterium]